MATTVAARYGGYGGYTQHKFRSSMRYTIKNKKPSNKRAIISFIVNDLNAILALNYCFYIRKCNERYDYTKSYNNIRAQR